MVYAPDRAKSVLHVAKKIGVERIAIIAYPSSNSLQIVAGAQELGQEAGPRGRADGEMGTRIRSRYHSKTLRISATDEICRRDTPIGPLLTFSTNCWLLRQHRYWILDRH